MSSGVEQVRLKRIRHVALDMDGTIYSGKTLFSCTLPFLQTLRELEIGHTFLTNNSSKSRGDYLLLLQSLGIPTVATELYTSTEATISFLRSNHTDVRRLFVLGTPSLRTEMAEAGFAITTDDPGDEPDAVVVGFDTSLVFDRLCRAAYWIKRGKLFVATHPDKICPTDQPTVLVDCGSICAALEQATGRKPNVVLGKPDPSMLSGILERHKLRPEELAMVGDRLYTDIAMTHRAGALGVLVLTGETTAAEAAENNSRIDLVVSDLAAFGALLGKSAGRA
jgi:NagD protein